MDMKTINTELTVSPQITAAEVAEIAAAGFRSIICNRPDGEGADQPVFTEIEQAARKFGIETSYLPVVSGKVTDEDAASFGTEFARLPKPVFVFRRTAAYEVTMCELG